MLLNLFDDFYSQSEELYKECPKTVNLKFLNKKTRFVSKYSHKKGLLTLKVTNGPKVLIPNLKK